MNKKIIISTIVIATTCACSFLLYSCKDKINLDNLLSKKEEKITPVKTITLSQTQNFITNSYVGTVEESSAISLSFQTIGNVKQIYVDEGQEVKKGQLLASLDKTTLQSAYDATKSTLDQAYDAYNRLEKIYKNGSLPEIKWVEVQSKVQQAKSAEQIARKALENADLFAPSSGIISQREIQVGSNVLPGIMAFKLVDINKVNVRISVPENEIASIKKGEEVKITISALNNRSFTGKITEKNVDANLLSHTYKVKINLNNSDHAMMPGMVCKAEIIRQQADNEIVVPNDAVQISFDNKYFVWLYQDDLAVRRFVTVGNLVENGVIITDGLSSGDRVITVGMQKISEGMKICEK